MTRTIVKSHSPETNAGYSTCLSGPRILCLVRLGIAALLLLGWAGLGRAAPPQVYVSILPQKHIVEQVGGGQVAVSVMVGPGQSPATYDPTPKQLMALADARLYFAIGVAFEDAWMNRIKAANPALHVVSMQRGILLLPARGRAGDLRASPVQPR